MSDNFGRIHGFYKKTHDQRLQIIKNGSSISEQEISLLRDFRALDFELANRMIENVVSAMPIPLVVAQHFFINKKNYFIPMAIEESRVIAVASYCAKIARYGGRVSASVLSQVMIGQIQLKHVPSITCAIQAIRLHLCYHAQFL